MLIKTRNNGQQFQICIKPKWLMLAGKAAAGLISVLRLVGSSLRSIRYE